MTNRSISVEMVLAVVLRIGFPRICVQSDSSLAVVGRHFCLGAPGLSTPVECDRRSAPSGSEGPRQLARGADTCPEPVALPVEYHGLVIALFDSASCVPDSNRPQTMNSPRRYDIAGVSPASMGISRPVGRPSPFRSCPPSLELKIFILSCFVLFCFVSLTHVIVTFSHFHSFILILRFSMSREAREGGVRELRRLPSYIVRPNEPRTGPARPSSVALAE